MALALYLLFALLAFLAADRGVAPVGWRSRAALAALPLALAGPALIAGRSWRRSISPGIPSRSPRRAPHTVSAWSRAAP